MGVTAVEPAPASGGPASAPPAKRGTFRFALLVVLLVGLAAVVLATDLDPRHLLADVREWPVPMPVLTIAGSAILVCALVPRTALSLAAGALLGMSTGTAYMLIGVTIGACLAFGVGHVLGRSFVETRLRGRAAVVERAVAARGVWAVAAARLLPVAHFGLSNYAFGTTSIGLPRYLVGTVLGIAPATVGYVALGDAVARADAADASLAGGLVLALSVAGFVASALLWRRRPTRAGRRSGDPVVPSAAAPVG